MANENQLVLEIVLDDGSVQRGFAKVKQSGENTAKSLGKNFSDAVKNISNPTDILASLVLIQQGLKIVGNTFKEAFNFVLLGEQVKAVNAQFNFLAESSNVAAESLKTQLEIASAGLADTTELLKAASEGFIRFGQSANQLPQILTLARQITAVFGGELTQNFENLSAAIANGSQRALKSVGIYIDIDKVTKDYAQTLGITANSLTQAEKQQAILNATLAEGEKRYSGVDLSLRATTDSFTRFKNTGKDTLESIATLTTSVFGPAFTAVFDKASSILQAFNLTVQRNFGTGLEAAKANVKALENEIKSLTNVLEQNSAVYAKSDIEIYSSRLIKLKEELRLAKISVEAFSGAITDPRQNISALAGRADEILSLIQRQSDQRQKAIEAQAKVELETNQKLLQSKAELGNLEIQLLKSKQTAENEDEVSRQSLRLQREQAELVHKQNLENIELTYQQKVKELKDVGVTDFVNLERIKNEQIEAENERSKLVLEKIELDAQAKEKQRLEQRISVLRSSLISGLQATTQSFANALISGQNALEAFGQGFVNIIADLAINLGNTLIIQGLAIESFIQSINSLLPGSGAAAAAAGLGLVLFGTALKAAIGKGGATTGPAVAPTGAVGGLPSETTAPSLTEPTELNRQVSAGITVNIQGDVLDSDETGIRITKILNDAFDKQGVVVRRGVFA